MPRRRNRKDAKGLRRYRRSHPTQAEKVMWAVVRDRQIENTKIRREYSVDSFSIDFYCAELEFAIEVDGETHDSEEAKSYDQWRQAVIEQLGIEFIRFTDDEVLNYCDRVVEDIAKYIRDRNASKNINPLAFPSRGLE